MVKKILFILLAVTLLAVIGLSVAVKIFLTPERIRTALLPVLESSLQREVSIGEIEVSLFKGLRVRDFIVSEKTGDGAFVATEEFVLHYQLLPILFGRIVLDEVTLVAPVINISRFQDGTFNFSDLLESELPTSSDATRPEDGGSGTEAASDLAVLVQDIRIERGAVHFMDHQIDPDAPLSFALTDFKLTASAVDLEGSFPILLSAVLGDAKFSATLNADIPAKNIKADVSLSGFNVPTLQPYYSESLPGHLRSALLSLGVHVDLSPERIRSSGEVRLDQLTFMPDESPPFALEDVRLSFTHDLSYELAEQSLELHSGLLQYNDLAVKMDGGVKFSPQLQLDSLAVQIPETDLQDIGSSLPKEIAALIRPYALAGSVEANLKLHGTVNASASPAEILQSAGLSFHGTSLRYEQLSSSLQGTVQYGDNRLASKGLLLSLDEDVFHIDADLFPVFGELPVLNVSLKGEQLDLDRILARLSPAEEGVPASGQSASAPPSDKKGKVSESGSASAPPVNAFADLSLEEVRFNQLAFKDVQLRLEMTGTELKVDPLTAKVAEGSIRADTVLALGAPELSYRGRLRLQNVHTDPLIRAFYPPAQGTLFGKVSLTSNFSGQGTDPETVQKQLKADGELRLSQFKLTGDGLASRLATFMELPDLRVMQFGEALLNVMLRQGVVSLEGELDGSDLRTFPKGTVELKGPIDVSVPMELSPEVSSKLLKKKDLVKALSGQDGWTRFPLKLSGTVEQPRFSLDTREVKAQATQKAKEEIREQLEKKVLKKLLPKDEEQASPEKKLLKGVLDNFLGN